MTGVNQDVVLHHGLHSLGSLDVCSKKVIVELTS